MPFVPVNNTALVEFVFDVRGNIMENTLWFEYTAPIGSGDLEELVGDLIGWWQAEIKPYQSIDTTLLRVKATDMSSATSPAYEEGLVTDNIGEINSSALPTQATWAIKFTTALRGRSYRGRNFIVGIPVSQTSGNEVMAAWANNILEGYIALETVLGVSGWDHVVVSKFADGEPRLSGVTTPVTSYSYTDRTIDTQRRRATGVGD